MTNSEAILTIDCASETRTDYDDVVAAVQTLVDSGVIWNLSHSYQKLMQFMVESGDITVTI